MTTTRPDKGLRALLNPTYVCAQPPALTALEEWCIMGGYWRVRQHEVVNRRLREPVLLACVEGNGWLTVEGRSFPVKADDVFYCPPTILHGYGCHAEGWTIYWVHCAGRQVPALLEAAGLTAAMPILPVARHPEVRSAFALLIDTLAGGGREAPWHAARQLHGLLLELVRQRHEPTAEGRKLVGLVSDDCRSLDELAAAAGLSRFHFCRLFKKETGRSPWQYVLDRRVERARELLLGSPLSIKQIATHLGFDNPDYFARLFKRACGVTPRRYRGLQR